MTLIAKIFLLSTSVACTRLGCNLVGGEPLLMSRMVPSSLVLRMFGDDAGMVCGSRLPRVIVGSVGRFLLEVVVGMRAWSMSGAILRGRIGLVLGRRRKIWRFVSGD